MPACTTSSSSMPTSTTSPARKSTPPPPSTRRKPTQTKRASKPYRSKPENTPSKSLSYRVKRLPATSNSHGKARASANSPSRPTASAPPKSKATLSLHPGATEARLLTHHPPTQKPRRQASGVFDLPAHGNSAVSKRHTRPARQSRLRSRNAHAKPAAWPP